MCFRQPSDQFQIRDFTSFPSPLSEFQPSMLTLGRFTRPTEHLGAYRKTHTVGDTIWAEQIHAFVYVCGVRQLRMATGEWRKADGDPGSVLCVRASINN